MKLLDSAKSTKQIISFFPSVIEQQHHEELPTDIDENISILVNEEDESLMDKESDLWETALRKLLSTNAKICEDRQIEKVRLTGGSFQYLQYLAIAKYFELLIAGETRMSASDAAERGIFRSGHNYKARCIRNWTAHYLSHDTVSLFQQGNTQRLSV